MLVYSSAIVSFVGTEDTGSFPKYFKLKDQEWGKEPICMTAGGVVNIPVGVKHWHGAATDSWFSHLAVEVPGENGHTEWCEPVSSEDYENVKYTWL